jgi:hypothetical protein
MGRGHVPSNNLAQDDALEVRTPLTAKQRSLGIGRTEDAAILSCRHAYPNIQSRSRAAR